MSVSLILLDSIDILVKDAVLKASYNSTIQATIVNCLDLVKGLYRCSYQDSKFYAYSNNTLTKYLKGAAVYVLIPNNDASQTRIILGSVDLYGAGYINLASEEERYLVIGINNITSNGVYYLNTNNKLYLQYLYTYNGGTNNVISIDSLSLAVYMKLATSVTFGAKIKTSILTSRQFRGEYGLIFKLRFLDNTSNNYEVRTYVLNQDNMIGNPYKLITPSRQTAIYNIDGKNFDRVESIAIYNKNFPDATGNTQSGILSSGDIELSLLELLSTRIIPDSELNGTVITFYTPQGTFFSTVSGDSNTKAITAQVKVQGKLLTSPLLIPFYWGRLNVGITTESRQYNPYLGRGWLCLNDSNIILTLKTEGTTVTQLEVVDWVPASDTHTVSIDDATAKNNLFKVAAIYDGNVITKTINIQNLRNATAVIEITSDSGTAFSFDIGHPTLTCIAMQGTTLLSNCIYYWGVEDSSGVFTSLPLTTDLNEDYEDAVEALLDYLEELGGDDLHLLSTQALYLASLRAAVAAYDGILRVDGKYLRDVQISNITDFATFKCSVYRTVGTNTIYLGTASIVLTNSLEAQPGYSLVINNGTVVFKYDNEGKAPNNRNLPNPQKIEALTISIYDDKGLLLSDLIISNPNNCQIRWMFPIEDTLLTGSLYNGEPSGTDPTGKYEYYDNLTTLLYDINSGYSVNKVNNQIKVSVTYKDEVTLNAETSFTFTKEGQIGANGTEYFVKLVPNTNMSSPPQYPIITYDNSQGKYYINYGIGSTATETLINTSQGYQFLKAELYHNGEKIWSGISASGSSLEGKQVSSVSWLVLSNKYSSSISDATAFEITAAATGGIKYKGDHLGSNYGSPRANIIKCSLTYDDKTFYGTMPITTAWVTNNNYRLILELSSGFRFVEYSTSGLNPQYSNLPFEFICKQKINDVWEDVSLVSGDYEVTFASSKCGSTMLNAIREWVEMSSNQLTALTDSWYTDDLLDNQFLYRPVEVYNGDCVNNTVLCQVTRNNSILAKMAVPIHFYLNRYGLSEINAWDGNSIKIKEDQGFILAPQVGAGKKENDNSFTGVIMGRAKLGGRTATDVGLVGYSHGTRSFFVDAYSGGAIFGANNGKICIDPSSSKAMIYSQDFWSSYNLKGFPNTYDEYNYSGSGMLIDLTTPKILWGNGNVSIDQNGYFSFGSGPTSKITFDQTGLKIRASQITMGGYDATTANNYTTTLSRLISDMGMFSGIFPFLDILDQYDIYDGDLALDIETQVVYKYNGEKQAWEATTIGGLNYTSIQDTFREFSNLDKLIRTYSIYFDPVDEWPSSDLPSYHIGDYWHYTGDDILVTDFPYLPSALTEDYWTYIYPGYYYQFTRIEDTGYYYWKNVDVSDELKSLIDKNITIYSRTSNSVISSAKLGDILYRRDIGKFYRWQSLKKQWLTLELYLQSYSRFMQFYAGDSSHTGGLLIGDLYRNSTGTGDLDTQRKPWNVYGRNIFITSSSLQIRDAQTVLADYASTGITFNNDIDFTIGDTTGQYIQWNSSNGKIVINANLINLGGSTIITQNDIAHMRSDYSGDYTPTNSNYPASNWSTSLRGNHAGLLFYKTNGDIYRYEATSVTGITVTFSSSSETESVTYDYVQIYYEYDGNIYAADKLGGTSIAGATVFIPNNKFWLYWHSDSSVVKYGFAISSISQSTQSYTKPTTGASLPNYSVTELSGSNYPLTDHSYGNNENILWKYTSSYSTSRSFNWVLDSNLEVLGFLANDSGVDIINKINYAASSYKISAEHVNIRAEDLTISKITDGAGDYAQVSSSGMKIYKNNSLIASFGSSIVLYKPGASTQTPVVTIDSNGGSFTGSIYASGGEIGGWTINPSSISATNLEISPSDGFISTKNNKSCILNEAYLGLLAETTGARNFTQVTDLGIHSELANQDVSSLTPSGLLIDNSNGSLEFSNGILTVNGTNWTRTTSVTSGSAALVTSGAVYSALGSYATTSALNNKFAVTVELMSTDTQIQAGKSGTVTKSISKSGYTPIGVVGVVIANNTDVDTGYSSYANAYIWRINGSSVEIFIRNMHSSGTTRLRISAHVLWSKN